MSMEGPGNRKYECRIRPRMVVENVTPPGLVCHRITTEYQWPTDVGNGMAEEQSARHRIHIEWKGNSTINRNVEKTHRYVNTWWLSVNTPGGNAREMVGNGSWVVAWLNVVVIEMPTTYIEG